MNNNQFRVLIKSVGTAQPAASVAVAKGLGLPASTVIARLYSAPAILVEGISETIAQQMVKILAAIGFEAEAQTLTSPTPPLSTLYDVAVYLEDVRQFQETVNVLSKFTGMSEEDASQMILLSPGVIMGSVSEATVNAFVKQLPQGVSVLSSQPEKAGYHLFLNEDEGGMIHQRILQDIKAAKIDLQAASGLVAMQVEHTVARDLWQRHQASGLLRIINEDFLRYDLVLQNKPVESENDEALFRVIHDVAGIPADMIEAVLQETPITLLESVPRAELGEKMQAFADAGLDVRADLITFQLLGLKILSVPASVDNRSLIQALESFGLHQQGALLPRPPFTLPAVMPELQARIIRATLEDMGLQIAYEEVSDEVR